MAAGEPEKVKRIWDIPTARRWLMTWAIEDRDGAYSYFTEVWEGQTWEEHVADVTERQQDDGSGRYVAKWRLVLLQLMTGGEASSDRLQKLIDEYDV